MPRPYDDDRYLQWYNEFQKLVYEYLDTEGNDHESLDAEFDNAKESFDADLQS